MDRIHVAGNERMATINNIPEPTDIMMAQASPSRSWRSSSRCIGIREHPASFDQSALIDLRISVPCVVVSMSPRRIHRQEYPVPARSRSSYKMPSHVISREAVDGV